MFLSRLCTSSASSSGMDSFWANSRILSRDSLHSDALRYMSKRRMMGEMPVVSFVCDCGTTSAKRRGLKTHLKLLDGQRDFHLWNVCLGLKLSNIRLGNLHRAQLLVMPRGEEILVNCDALGDHVSLDRAYLASHLLFGCHLKSSRHRLIMWVLVDVPILYSRTSESSSAQFGFILSSATNSLGHVKKCK